MVGHTAANRQHTAPIMATNNLRKIKAKGNRRRRWRRRREQATVADTLERRAERALAASERALDSLAASEAGEGGGA
jgi:hypothetical protein